MSEFRWRNMSVVRKRYFIRLLARTVIFAVCAVMCFAAPEQFSVLEGWNFFSTPTLLHILWIIWLFDMLQQLVPISRHIPLGSKKLFRQHFRPIRDKFSYDALKNYIVFTTKTAFRVLLLWAALLLVIGLLYYSGMIDRTGVFMISACFYVCDLICVLIWCPFRLIMKNRCCTTCRIFNTTYTNL